MSKALGLGLREPWISHGSRLQDSEPHPNLGTLDAICFFGRKTAKDMGTQGVAYLNATMLWSTARPAYSCGAYSRILWGFYSSAWRVFMGSLLALKEPRCLKTRSDVQDQHHVILSALEGPNSRFKAVCPKVD